MNLGQKLIIIITFILASIFIDKDMIAQTKYATVSGFIIDNNSEECLIGATISDNHKYYSVSNNYGFYSLTLPVGKQELTCAYLGYENYALKINLQKDTVVVFKLQPNASLKESTISAIKNSGFNSVYAGSFDIPIDKITSMPLVFGEADILKTVQMLPGIQSGMEGTSGIYVRGGGTDENLMLLDGVPLYNVDHVLGLFSVFTPEAVKKVTVYKGAFPASYSGRISSIVDVRTNEGNMKRLSGSVSVGLLNSKLHLEGPIIKDRTSFSISGRAMHTLILTPIIKLFDSPANYFFYDLNGKITHKLNDKNTFGLSVYNGLDKLDVDYEEDDSYDDNSISVSNSLSNIHWGNTIVSGRWSHLYNGKLFSNTTLAFNNYRNRIITGLNQKYNFKENNLKDRVTADYRSGIEDFIVKIDYDWILNKNHSFKFGSNFIYHRFLPETRSFKEYKKVNEEIKTDTLFHSNSNKALHGTELSFYIQDDISIGNKLQLNPGLHFALFNTEGKTYISPEPRLAVKYELLNGFSTKLSYSRMSQYVHLLSSSIISMPTDLWVPITKNIKPVYSNQVSLGLYCHRLKGFELSLETYYKRMYNVLEYQDGMSMIGNSSLWDERVEMGKGRAYGMEFFLEKKSGKTTGWLSYTLAKSERKFNGINDGKAFPYKYDRRNSLNIYLNHKFSPKIDVGATWTFTTGGTMTVPLMQNGMVIPPSYPHRTDYNFVKTFDYVSGRNNYRLPSSHRLNIGINFHKKNKRGGESVWNISIYNVYNAMNPNIVYANSKYDYSKSNSYDEYYREYSLKKITILPLVPSFNYIYKF